MISQTALQRFQEEMSKVINDPYKVVMKQTGLPISLLNEKSKVSILLVICVILTQYIYVMCVFI